MFDLSQIARALVTYDEDKVMELVKKAMADGEKAGDILNKGLVVGMDIVGEKMESGEMFIPEVLMAARVMSVAIGHLKPELKADDVAGMGRVVIGTVEGDLHDIGKNLVAMMLESAGFEVFNLGTDVAPDRFVREIEEKEADIVCMSALLTTTMPKMKETIDAITASGLRDRVKILIGGAPVTQAFADQINADGYGPDAGSAVKTAKAIR